MAFFVNGSIVGVDLNNTNTTQQFALGSRILGSDGTTWQYVQAATTVTSFAVMAITTGGTCGKASVADAMAGRQLAFAQNTFQPNDFGWVPLNGTGGPATTMNVLGLGTVTANVALYLSSTTGVLSTQTSSSATVAGVYLFGASGSATTTVTVYPAIMTWPKVLGVGL